MNKFKGTLLLTLLSMRLVMVLVSLIVAIGQIFTTLWRKTPHAKNVAPPHGYMLIF